MSARVPGGAGSRVVGPGLPRRLTVTDDRGTTSTASFSGGGSDDEWQGRFEVSPGLAPDTAWVEVLGERIGLPSAPDARLHVRVESQADADPAHRYLWVKLASVADFDSADTMETSIEALVAAGALEAGTRLSARSAPSWAPSSRGRAPPARQTRRCRSHGGRRLARRGRPSGPERLAVVGATTPPLDGFTLAILAIRSTDERFYADVETVPGLAHSHWPSGVVDRPPLAWWAADDRGQHYLGKQGEWRFSEDRSGGQSSSGPRWIPPRRCSTSCPPR